MPPQIGLISGMVQGIAEQHIGSIPEDQLAVMLDWVISEIVYWRTGERDLQSVRDQTGKPNGSE